MQPTGRRRTEPVGQLPTADRQADTATATWLAALRDEGSGREAALTRLHEILLGVARSELRRRSGRHGISGVELDDLAHQAADDALVAITGKLDQFRGESKFTTWAYRFVVLEVSTKLGRHFWRRPTVNLDAEQWDQLPDRFGVPPDQHVQRRELVAVIRRAVEQTLTPRQRQVFVAIAVNGVPLDALVARLGTTRNAVYKVMFDARSKLRAALAAAGHLPAPTERPVREGGDDGAAG